MQIFGTVASEYAYNKFCAVTDNAAVFLRDAGQETGRIHKRDQRNIEAIAHTHEARHLVAGVNVDHARHNGRLLTDNAHAMSADARESDDGIPRPTRLDFEEGIFINDLFNHLMHHIRFAWVKRESCC